MSDQLISLDKQKNGHKNPYQQQGRGGDTKTDSPQQPKTYYKVKETHVNILSNRSFLKKQINQKGKGKAQSEHKQPQYTKFRYETFEGYKICCTPANTYLYNKSLHDGSSHAGSVQVKKTSHQEQPPRTKEQHHDNQMNNKQLSSNQKEINKSNSKTQKAHKEDKARNQNSQSFGSPQQYIQKSLKDLNRSQQSDDQNDSNYVIQVQRKHSKGSDEPLKITQNLSQQVIADKMQLQPNYIPGSSVFQLSPIYPIYQAPYLPTLFPLDGPQFPMYDPALMIQTQQLLLESWNYNNNNISNQQTQRNLNQFNTPKKMNLSTSIDVSDPNIKVENRSRKHLDIHAKQFELN